MDYKIEQTIEHPLEIIEKAMFDPKLINFYLKEMDAIDEMESLEFNDNGDQIERKIRYQPKPIIKRIGFKKIPPEALGWIEVSTYDKKSKILSYDNQSIHPKVRKIFTNIGKIELIPSNNSTIRVISGEVKVDVKIVGKVAEKVIYKTAKKVLNEEVEALKKFISLYY